MPVGWAPDSCQDACGLHPCLCPVLQCYGLCAELEMQYLHGDHKHQLPYREAEGRFMGLGRADNYVSHPWRVRKSSVLILDYLLFACCRTTHPQNAAAAAMWVTDFLRTFQTCLKVHSWNVHAVISPLQVTSCLCLPIPSVSTAKKEHWVVVQALKKNNTSYFTF